MSENRTGRISGAMACAAVAFVVSCGINDYSLDPQDVPQPPPPPPPQVLSWLIVSGSTNGAFVGLKVRLGVTGYDVQGRNMSTDQAIVTSSNVSVADVSALDVHTVNDNPGRTSYRMLSPQIAMLAPGSATIHVSLQGVTSSIDVVVRALPMLSTALVVDTFTVVEYPICATGSCPYLGYAPLLRLREPTGSTTADVIAVEFNVPTKTTGWCTGQMSFAKGQSLHLNGVDPYMWNNDMVFFQLNGAPLPEGPATARVIVRDATGTWGMIEATAPIKRGVTNPDFPFGPVGFWSCTSSSDR